MMKKALRFFFALLAVAMMPGLLSCEKAVLDEEEKQQGTESSKESSTKDTTEGANLVLRVSGFSVVPFETRAQVPIADYCTRLNFVVYRDSKKVKAITQKQGDVNYGQVGMDLEKGLYQVLVVAHSSKGNPSLANPEKIQFTNDDGFSDTFYFYGEVTVTDEQLVQDVVLERVTSMLRFQTEDPVPAEVQQIRLYFTGGSGALDATTGYGCVNSQQMVYFDITEDMVGRPVCLETYTILKAETATLKLVVTAYGTNPNDGSVKILGEKEFASVPMERNKITQYSGWFFSERPQASHSFRVVAETDWGGVTELEY